MKPPAHPRSCDADEDTDAATGADDRSHIDGAGRIGTISRTATPPFEINLDFAFWDDYAFYGDDGGFRVIDIKAPGKWDGGVLGWEPRGGAAGE